jgi:hypothetical protein
MTTAIDRIDGDETSHMLYERLMGIANALGGVAVEEKKTSIHVTRRRAFLGVHPRKGGLLINIVTDTALRGERLRKQEQVSANRWHNEVLLTDPAQLDAELVGWIRQAHELAS